MLQHGAQETAIVSTHDIEECQATGNWKRSIDILSDAAQCLEKAKADFIVICSNTMHKIAEEIAANVSIPVLHVADMTAQELIDDNIAKIALLGTKYTMEHDFYKSKLFAHGIDVVIPDNDDRILVNDTIYNELCLGVVSDKSKEEFLYIIDRAVNKGAQGVILGCTEIGLLVQQKDTSVRLYDTTLIHARKAALFSIGHF